jgi:hypothetical protein
MEMSGERMIWVVYQEATPAGDGAPRAAFTFTPGQSDIEEVARRFEEEEGYFPELLLAAVPLYQAPVVPSKEG